MKNLELKQKITQKLDTLTTEELTLVDTLLTNLNSYFQNQKTPHQIIPKSEEERRKLIRDLRGKYRHLPNSSEDFAERKQEEIDSKLCYHTNYCPDSGAIMMNTKINFSEPI